MKFRFANTLLSLALLSVLAGTGLAQGAASPLPPLVAQLKLSQGQLKKLTPMYEENARKLKTLREDSALSADDKRSRINEINQTTNKTLNEILTSSQREKLRDLRRQSRQSN
ncbi:MAG: hypothetical protein SF339_18065 [Blastocatellia bacterium]|nr:hypothetical protein [Blastocatellia bacterium]